MSSSVRPVIFLIVGDETLGVGLRLLDELSCLLFSEAQTDGITIALRHLATIEARDLRRIVEQAFRFGEYMTIAIVEATSDLARDLDMRQLILTDGHDTALAEQNIARLMNRIGKQKPGERMT